MVPWPRSSDSGGSCRDRGTDEVRLASLGLEVARTEVSSPLPGQ